MMSFIKRIKDSLNDQNNRRGRQDKCLINVNDLRELIYHFERLESINKLNYSETHINNIEKLNLVIQAMFKHSNGNSNMIFVNIMDILQPLIKEKLKDQAIEYNFNYPK